MKEIAGWIGPDCVSGCKQAGAGSLQAHEG